jgi:hypothetical protein
MHVDHEVVEYVAAEEQDYEEIVEEYEEEIFVPEEFQEPPGTDTSDIAPDQDKASVHNPYIYIYIYIYRHTHTLQEFYDTHIHRHTYP